MSKSADTIKKEIEIHLSYIQTGLTQKELLQRIPGITQGYMSKLLKSMCEDGKIIKELNFYKLSTTESRLKILFDRLNPDPSPVFNISSNTIAVKIRPIDARIWEYELPKCFINEDYFGGSECFSVTTTGELMTIMFWDCKKGYDYSIDTEATLSKNIAIIGSFFKQNIPIEYIEKDMLIAAVKLKHLQK